MNKAEMIEHIAQAAEISKSAAERAVDAMVGAIKSSLRKGDMVTLVGFGSFYVSERAARTGRNPRTGEELKIGAARVPKFRSGKALKDAIN
ncbi:MAG: HU family DNA-binding protein [Sphingomonadaceae bacterium]